MEQVTTNGVRRGTLMVRSLRELQDHRGDRVPAAAAIERWTRKLLPLNRQDAVLVFLLDKAERVRAVHELAATGAGAQLVRDAFRAAIVFDAARIVLVYSSRRFHAAETSSETDRLLRRAARLLGMSVAVMVRADLGEAGARTCVRRRA